MEKIQNAIAKARAQRGATQRTPRAVRRSVGEVSSVASGNDPVSAAWDSLPELKLDIGQMERNRVVSFSSGRAASSVDMMRTRILQQMRANKWRRLAITSGSAGCGKSTVSLNLAFSLSQQPDFRTVLLEMDVRRPSLAKTLGCEEGHNFAAVLNGSARFEDNALRYGKNLIVSTNNGPWPNPVELIHGAHLPKVLAEIEETYEPDMVIMDIPPMLVSEDMVAFLDHVDCVVLIAAADATTAKQVDICERELASRTNFLGVVLNKCRYIGPDYSYGYYE